MIKKITSVYLLSFLAVVFPVSVLLAMLSGLVIGNFTFFLDEEKFDKTLNTLWFKWCQKTIIWGQWKIPA